MVKKSIQKQIEEKIKNKRKRPEPIYELISSGSTWLDMALGGGFPLGCIVNVVGGFSSSKTLLAIETIVEARKKYGDKLVWFYDDCESGFSFDTKELYDFEIISKEQKSSETVEDLSDNIFAQLKMLSDDQILIYVVDSLDGLTCDAELNREEKERSDREKGKTNTSGSYKMEKAKLLSQLFRTKTKSIADKKCLLIIISQVRDNIAAMFGNKDTRSGGRALDFYCSQVVWLAKAGKKEKTHKGRKRSTGVTIKAKVKKNKIAKPFREAYIEILFDYGVDDITSNLNFLYDLITETGKTKGKIKIDWVDSSGNEHSFDKNEAIQWIEENNEEELLKERVKELWDEIEAEVAPDHRKRKR